MFVHYWEVLHHDAELLTRLFVFCFFGPFFSKYIYFSSFLAKGNVPGSSALNY